MKPKVQSVVGVLAIFAIACGGLTSGESGLAGDSGIESGSRSLDSSVADRASPDSGPPDTGRCPYGESLCDTVCVNEQTNPANCGGCGLACSGTCKGGRCAVTFESTPGWMYNGDPFGIAVNATGIYVTQSGADDSPPGNGSVITVPIAGGTATTLASKQAYATSGIAIDDTSVYWTTFAEPGGVMKMALTGGAITTLASGQFFALAVAVDATHAYWTNGTQSDSATGTVMKVPLGGGALTTLASGQAAPSSGVSGIAVDADNVYWTNSGTSSDDGAVMKVALNGGALTTLASAQVSPWGVAADSTHIFWTQNAGVMSLPLAGGIATTLAFASESSSAIAIDATSVYWFAAGPCALMKVPIGGGAATTLWSESYDHGHTCIPAGAIAVDNTSVYWTSSNHGTMPPSGTVVKLTPK